MISLLLLGAQAAHAESALIIVDRIDQAEEAALELVKATARQGLVAKGWSIIEAFDAKMAPAQMTALARCMLNADAKCVERAVEGAPALSHVLVVTVKASGPINGSNTYELLALLSPRGGKPMHSLKRFCERCNAASLETTAGDLTSEILLELAGTGTLAITSDPPGATVRVDGEPVGLTPVTVTTRAGDHMVSFEKTGFLTPADVKVAVQSGGMSPVSRTLVPEVIDGGDKPALAVPISLIALGAVGVGVGTYFILTGGPPSEGEDRKPTQMRVPGIFIAGGGAVVAGVGTYLLVKQLSKKKGKEGVAMGASFGPGFVFISGAGRF